MTRRIFELLRLAFSVWLSPRWIGVWMWLFLAGLLLIVYSGRRSW